MRYVGSRREREEREGRKRGRDIEGIVRGGRRRQKQAGKQEGTEGRGWE